jgi:hypothetical protein
MTVGLALMLFDFAFIAFVGIGGIMRIICGTKKGKEDYLLESSSHLASVMIRNRL